MTPVTDVPGAEPCGCLDVTHKPASLQHQQSLAWGEAQAGEGVARQEGAPAEDGLQLPRVGAQVAETPHGVAAAAAAGRARARLLAGFCGARCAPQPPCSTVRTVRNVGKMCLALLDLLLICWQDAIAMEPSLIASDDHASTG